MDKKQNWPRFEPSSPSTKNTHWYNLLDRDFDLVQPD